MSKFKIISLLLILLISISIFGGCYGSFTLTKKIYQWNGGLGDIIDTVVMWVLSPVYGACISIDFLVLNTIEYWLGSNPLALSSEEKETRVVKSGDKEYEVTIGNYQIDILEIKDSEKGEATTFIFDKELNAWFLQNDKAASMIVQLDENKKKVVEMFHPVIVN
jgi:hypothetical protein